jgi:hypothetical protein
MPSARTTSFLRRSILRAGRSNCGTFPKRLDEIGGSTGQGVGGGAYFASGGSVCLDAFTVADIFGNTASTSNNDIFGGYTLCWARPSEASERVEK